MKSRQQGYKVRWVVLFSIRSFVSMGQIFLNRLVPLAAQSFDTAVLAVVGVMVGTKTPVLLKITIRFLNDCYFLS
jgi:hypothetical protein